MNGDINLYNFFRFLGVMSDDDGDSSSYSSSESDESDSEYEYIHDIRQNMHKLGRIHGKRIWNELQQIIKGNQGCELMVTFLISCGGATFVGKSILIETKFCWRLNVNLLMSAIWLNSDRAWMSLFRPNVIIGVTLPQPIAKYQEIKKNIFSFSGLL